MVVFKKDAACYARICKDCDVLNASDYATYVIMLSMF